ncbi:uncharacterized protein [Dysidea avara]|uniref:uncharacterized protein n=1 Tax=Dysidea avara TaxID=196820 RepID=UPI0033261565
MLIHIKLGGGILCKESIEVDCTGTVKWLKDEISKTMNIRELIVHPFDLIYVGKGLEDERTIGSYNIQHDCTEHLVIRVPGGGDGWCLGTQLGITCSDPWKCRQPIYGSPTKLHEVVAQRSDACEVVCEAFNIGNGVKNQIEDNSADPSIRLTDAVHYLYHQSHWWYQLTWHDVIIKVKAVDIDLAEVIEQSGLVDNNQNTCLIM